MHTQKTDIYIKEIHITHTHTFTHTGARTHIRYTKTLGQQNAQQTSHPHYINIYKSRERMSKGKLQRLTHYRHQRRQLLLL